MKVLWLSTFPLNELEQLIDFVREPKSHPTSWVYNLAIELTKPEYDVHLSIITLSPHIKEDSCVTWMGIDVYVLKSGIPFINRGYPSFFGFDRLTKYFFESRKICKTITKVKPLIIHIHGTESAYVTLVGRFRDKTILSIQGVYSDIFRNARSVHHRLQSLYEREAIREGRYFGVRTQYDSAFVKKINPNGHLFLLNEAISRVFYDKVWNPKSSITIVYVGTVIERKGLHVLIEAVSHLIPKQNMNTIQIKVIGGIDIGYKQHIDSLLARQEIGNRISFYGPRNREFIAQTLAEGTIFVLPSFYENSPNSLAEAMAVGIPTIAADVGGVRSMVDNEVSGLLFKAGDYVELADKIEMLLTNNELMRKISKNAKDVVFKKQYPSKVAKETILAYKTVAFDE